MLKSQQMRLRSIKWILIVLGIIGLAFISWPKFELFQCRSIQSEAKAKLYHMYEAQQFYHAYHHEYTSLENLIEIGLIQYEEKNYTYKIPSYTSKTFEIRAIGKTLTHDEWTIDQTGEIRVIHHACTVK